MAGFIVKQTDMLFITAMIKEVCSAVCFVFLKDRWAFSQNRNKFCMGLYLCCLSGWGMVVYVFVLPVTLDCQ